LRPNVAEIPGTPRIPGLNDNLKEETKILHDLFKKIDTDSNDSELNQHLKRIID